MSNSTAFIGIQFFPKSKLRQALKRFCFAVEKRIFCVGKKIYIVYADIRFCCLNRKPEMKSHQNIEEIRWQVVKAMLKDFPALRKKVKGYIEKAEN
jgi:hypothetical protein